MEKVEIKYICPNNGIIVQNNVNFLCNRCGVQKTIRVGNTYMCPECLEPEAKLECRLCGSKKVAMDIENKDKILSSIKFPMKEGDD